MKYYLYLTKVERSEIIKSLIDYKNKLQQKGKHTDAVDDLIIKISYAKRKKIRVI